MKLIDTKDAVGHVICHDMTQIIKDVKSGVVFRKGHVIREEDIPVLLSIGKDHIYIWEKQQGMLHENEAAEILCDLCKNVNISRTEVKEGKIELIAQDDGLFKLDKERLEQINSLGDIIISTRHSDFPVKKGDKLAGTRVIPLVIAEEKLMRAVEIAGDKPLFNILPFKRKKVGIVTTGNEVFYGRIKDQFGPVIRGKFSEYDVSVIGQKILGDHTEHISEAIIEFINEGADLVVCTGGMSVDPDDTTPSAIKRTGAEIVSYGAPVLPGAMFLMAYYDHRIPIMGLPGCVMYNGRTIFDLILPRVLADDRMKYEDFIKYGHGGMCLKCQQCYFPNCGFGK